MSVLEHFFWQKSLNYNWVIYLKDSSIQTYNVKRARGHPCHSKLNQSTKFRLGQVFLHISTFQTVYFVRKNLINIPGGAYF